ncbi:protein takeout-like [Lycorma delicatula]|uniref:protein takeout-like n=1 Tax=Lycorma delicatula TaxID=130591 RepID=UPI003F51A1ED
MYSSYIIRKYIFMYKHFLAILFILNMGFPFTTTDKLKDSDVINVCHTSDPGYNQCVKKMLHSLKPYLIKGVPKLKIPSVEPMIVPQILIQQGSGPVSIDSKFTNQKFHGITNYTVTSLKIEPDKYRIEFDVSLPWLYVEGDYAIKGQMLVLPISGSGDSWSNYTSVTGKAIINGHPEIKNGKKYFELDDFKFSINVKKAIIHMNNLFNGNQQLGDSMNKFMSENWELVFQELKPVVDESISVLLKDIIVKVFKKFTFDELFPK